ncbi:hypothetical protein Pmani_008397 [Petrolisthes manimaculis]|uniref:Uncharacterized protein n=1 Tax=Petrolisthes manimaculis TaxID=1843537 RepID=A0AAE1UDY8_9EUCA|nr:hypothetical protein Pmani_008397 [Petrolisthes manimaculis]
MCSPARGTAAPRPPPWDPAPPRRPAWLRHRPQPTQVPPPAPALTSVSVTSLAGITYTGGSTRVRAPTGEEVSWVCAGRYLCNKYVLKIH